MAFSFKASPVLALFIVLFFFFLMIRRPPRSTLFPYDALPISASASTMGLPISVVASAASRDFCSRRSEEHTSELQSRSDLVCRLLLEKKKKILLTTYLLIKKKKTYDK